MSDTTEQEPEGLDVSREAEPSADYEAGRRAERERIAAIVESPAAEGRKELAVHLALHTPDIAHEQAIALLEKAPRPRQTPPIH